jgi:histidine triad (HIT) family protein
MSGCIFCKIINREMKTDFVFENDNFVVFKDINPKADVHLLLVPKKHIESINYVNIDNEKFLSGAFLVIKQVAQKLGFDKNGFRVVINTGKDAGQEVLHIHFHILAGRKFGWPPG